MKRNQKGFSLVELIVVLAIMSVLTTVGLLSFSLVTGQSVRSCASDLESFISQTRIQAMSRADASLAIYVKNDGVYATLTASSNGTEFEIDTQKIGKSSITVKYTTDDGQTYTLQPLSGDKPTDAEKEDLNKTLVLGFDRSSGAFKQLLWWSGGTVNCTEIRLEGGSSPIKIILVPQTGKYYTEM